MAIYVRVNPRSQLESRHRAGLLFTALWMAIDVDSADRAAIEQDPYLEVSESDPTEIETAALETELLDNPPSTNSDGALAQVDAVIDSAELATVDSSGDAPEVVDDPIEPVTAIEVTGVTSQAAAPASADDLVNVKEAITRLDKTNPANWLKDGRPSTKAIEEIVGVTVSSGLRDLAWADIRTEAAE